MQIFSYGVLLFLGCLMPILCYSSNGQNDRPSNNDPYQSFSELPPDDDEAPPEYPASGSGPILPPEG